jgi:hypothetical protein
VAHEIGSRTGTNWQQRCSSVTTTRERGNAVGDVSWAMYGTTVPVQGLQEYVGTVFYMVASADSEKYYGSTYFGSTHLTRQPPLTDPSGLKTRFRKQQTWKPNVELQGYN